MRSHQPLLDGKAELWDDLLAVDGRLMEMLGEHQRQRWLDGYLLTGRQEDDNV